MYKFQFVRSPGLFLAATVVVGVHACVAQDHSHDAMTATSPSSSRAASPGNPAVGLTISFQLKDWKQMHFHDAEAAEKHRRTVEQIGCVAKTAQHGGHIDVRYHCQEWKSISFDNAGAAQQWHDWLLSAGFDVYWPRPEAAFSSGEHAVHFRKLEFQTLHGDGSPGQNQFVDTLRKTGCDVRVVAHNGHTDIQFRAPAWSTIRVADEAATAQWRQWFVSQGFETTQCKESCCISGQPKGDPK